MQFLHGLYLGNLGAALCIGDAMSWYGDMLLDHRWKNRRQQIIDRDDGICLYCGVRCRHPHVHHKQYISGRKPWEYGDDDLETVCPECHRTITIEQLYQKLYANAKRITDETDEDKYMAAFVDSVKQVLKEHSETISTITWLNYMVHDLGKELHFCAPWRQFTENMYDE